MAELKLENIQYSAEEYLSIDSQSQDRYEFDKGRIWAMPGTSTNHNRIIHNLVLSFLTSIKAKGSKCEIFTESIRLELKQAKAYYYPDLIYTCNPLDLQEKNMVRSPSLIIEVLSESSFSMDLSQKLDNYITIPSLLYYLVISQDEYRIRIWEKSEGRWIYSVYTQLLDTIDLSQININLTLEDVYENIVWE